MRRIDLEHHCGMQIGPTSDDTKGKGSGKKGKKPAKVIPTPEGEDDGAGW